MYLQGLRYPSGVGDLESVGQLLGGAQANAQADVGTTVPSYRVDDLEQEPQAFRLTSAVSVRASVGRRREELRDEVAMSGMDLDSVVSGTLQVLRGTAEGLDDRGDVLMSHLPRRIRIARRADRRGGHRRMIAIPYGPFAPQVQNLSKHDDAAGVQCGDFGSQRLDRTLIVSFCQDPVAHRRARVHYRSAGEHQSRAGA